MSNIRKDERPKNLKLELPTLASSHAKYVIQITKNPKVFKPEYGSAVTDGLIKQAMDINRLIWAANNVLVRSPEDYRLRREYQKRTAVTCNTLLADIGVARRLFHLSAKRMRYWTGMVVEIRNRTRGWMQDDASRYTQYR